MSITTQDYLSESLSLMVNFGLVLPHNHVFIDGEIHRVATVNSKGQKDAWYCFHSIGNNGHIAGAYGEWRESGKTVKYKSWEGEIMSSEQRDMLNKVVNIKFEQSEIKRKNDLEKCIERCIEVWSLAKTDGYHDYLLNKKIALNGAKLHDNKVIVPVHDIDLNIKGLQKIEIDSKRFETGTNKKGNSFLIGKIPLDTGKVLFCEGYATGSTLFDATKLPVVVCFDAGNLDPVIENYRQKYQFDTHEFIICADDDRENKSGNVGIEKANHAAEMHSCRVIVPLFNDESSNPTDFNDLFLLQGMEEVKSQILGRIQRQEQLEDCELPIKYLGDMITIIESCGSEINRSATIHGAISFISHCCAGQIETSTNENCNLFIANASRSSDNLNYISMSIDNMFRHIMYNDDNEEYGTVRTDRFTNASQVNTHFKKHKSLLYLPDDIGGAVSKRNYQSSGALDSVLSKIKSLATGNVFSFVGDDGKKNVIDNPSMGIYANLKESDFYHFAKTSDSGFLTLFITNVVKDYEFKHNKSKRRSQITNKVHSAFVEHCQTILNNSRNEIVRKSAIVLDFEYSPEHYKDDFTSIVDEYGLNEHRSYINAAFDNFKRLSAIIAYWNGERNTISKSVTESCAKYVCYRLKVLIEELNVKKSDDITGDVRARVLDTIYKSGNKGIAESILIRCCSLYRKLSVDDRMNLISAMIMDKHIEERINSSKGRQGKRFFIIMNS
ncbi:MAG: hypothetical protein ACXVC7_14120 [Bacteroidia bacterium]